MSAGADEAEMLAYMRHLWEIEEAGERVPVSFGPFTAITVVGLLQLGLRHPDLSSGQRAITNELIDQFRPFFAGTLGETLILMGDDPRNDR